MYSIKMRSSQQSKHISGAETICDEPAIADVLLRFFNKGFDHENGAIDFLNLKIEKVTRPLTTIQSLPIYDNNDTITNLASQVHINPEILQKAWSYIEDSNNYSGAIILSVHNGQRLDDTGLRGIRVTRFMFETQHNYNDRIQDAITIASCINQFPGVIAELCVSDDLTYTTGYFASTSTGYQRIKNIKKKGSRNGGRIIFVDNTINLEAYRNYLEILPKKVIDTKA
ncbi:6-carboxyhexanoate--CoA ligase [Staphylococcus gallinarum]|uniref:6-carboxyhexanoate--CoA ligase n=1 Tax=Staphylococcus gallinarum TaxID=1293 RepID=UPI001E419BB8|nr:6-carboxyhexanoate--CoA ligase [Staphylococcus gallinarum]MCD8899504.1 6-carboxyhexanoate--CoA ligase [Staphylococcus gallinarum]MCD8903027.1 6-carboxyhexanoate--CoA ligase [Staphylococcus gallinarum]MEB6237035.1 6-carboxyhexanoate--CoA ligase [Staphylococcus gallinarum]